MRKAIIEVNPKFFSKFFPKGFFKNLEYIEGKALLRMDFEKNVKITIADIKMKEGATLKDFKASEELKILEVLKKMENTYTCLIKVKYKKNPFNYKELRPLRVFRAENIIFDFPFIVSKDKIIFTIVTDSDNLKKILKILKPLGLIKNLSFQKPTFSDYNVLSCLTERQKEVMIVAMRNGYYEVPREITTQELAEKLDISKATVLEHLRKAENRIISQVAAGYWMKLK